MQVSRSERLRLSPGLWLGSSAPQASDQRWRRPRVHPLTIYFQPSQHFQCRIESRQSQGAHMRIVMLKIVRPEGGLYKSL